MNERQITAVFPDSRRAAAARDRLVTAGLPAGDIATRDAAIPQFTAAAREGSFMARVVVIIVLWSIVGTAIGAGLGAALSTTIGPHGTSGLIVQMVSWAIFAHMLGGIWAGYLLLADRSGREIGHGRPVILTARCGTIDETFLAEQLRQLGATSVEAGEQAPGPQR